MSHLAGEEGLKNHRICVSFLEELLMGTIDAHENLLDASCWAKDFICIISLNIHRCW